MFEIKFFKAFFLRSSDGLILAKTGNQGKGVDFNVPDILRRASFTCTSTNDTCLLFNQTGLPKSATETTNEIVEVLNASAEAPQFVPQSL